MSRTSLRDAADRPAGVSPRPKVTRRSVSWARMSHKPVGGAGFSRNTGSDRLHRSEAITVQALMDLALPRFEGLEDGPRQVHMPWKMSAESPASPDTSYVVDRRRSSSSCLNLDELSSSDDGSVGSVRLSDLSVTLLCGSDDDHTPVNSDQVLSNVDLPPESVSNDKRQVIRIRDVSPDVQTVDVSQVGRAWDSRWTVSQGGSGKRMPLPLNIPATTTSGRELDVVPRSSGSDAARWMELWQWRVWNPLNSLLRRCQDSYPLLLLRWWHGSVWGTRQCPHNIPNKDIYYMCHQFPLDF